jgi:hypothetical protein
MTSLSPIAPRLEKLLLMLSSDQQGEVVNAARAVGRALQSIGADWHDLVGNLLVPGRQPGPQADPAEEDADWRSIRSFCLNHEHELRPRELEFVTSLGSWRGELTEKQAAWLKSIHGRLRKKGL